MRAFQVVCTHRSHAMILSGIDEEGKFRTRAAQAYPPKMCQELAEAHLVAWEKRSPLCAEQRAAELVDKELVLDRILNYCLNSLHSYMSSTEPCAQRLLDRYTLQTTVTCSLPEGVALHARPVALIARVVEHYGTPVRMKIGESECYAGSILQVLMAVGKDVGAKGVSFSGDKEPLEDLRLLFESGLGETDRPLPKELSYLAR